MGQRGGLLFSGTAKNEGHGATGLGADPEHRLVPGVDGGPGADRQPIRRLWFPQRAPSSGSPRRLTPSRFSSAPSQPTLGGPHPSDLRDRPPGLSALLGTRCASSRSSRTDPSSAGSWATSMMAPRTALLRSAAMSPDSPTPVAPSPNGQAPPCPHAVLARAHHQATRPGTAFHASPALPTSLPHRCYPERVHDNPSPGRKFGVLQKGTSYPFPIHLATPPPRI